MGYRPSLDSVADVKICINVVIRVIVLSWAWSDPLQADYNSCRLHATWRQGEPATHDWGTLNSNILPDKYFSV